MNDFDNMVAIKSKRYLSAIYFIGSILFVLACCGAIFYNIVDLYERIICWIGILFFGVCAIKSLFMFIFPKVIFTYNDEGFYIEAYDKFIKWNEVSKIDIYKVKSTKMITAKVHNEEYFVKSLSNKAKLIYKANKNICGYGIFISLATSGVKIEDMLALFQSKCINLTTPFE